MEITSLGCGGGRLQIIDQTFRTGGFRIQDDFDLHVDPGPGAILLSSELNLDPTKLDGVFVSHSHSDHCTDAGVLVEAMSRESSSPGIFLGSETAVDGNDDLGPALTKYHRGLAGELISLEEGESFDSGDLDLEATPTTHSDPSAVGFKIYAESGVVGYTSDTHYFDDLKEIFEDCRVLIANVTRPDGRRIQGHLCSKDLVELLKEVNPELSMILHMGMLFLRNNPRREAALIEEESGVRTVPGFVGTKISVDEDVEVERGRTQMRLNGYS